MSASGNGNGLLHGLWVKKFAFHSLNNQYVNLAVTYFFHVAVVALLIK